ncbi:MAG: hypothetical protein B9S34_14800 [Opitutia bacterium Tous-C1TDCM]|nr:MAG: hypothetical protein B9S34_14800 [Opitutae bacterium Tous-C1TDCM]
MRHKLHSITPGQAAVNGALDIFVEGHGRSDVKQMLVGLTVLASATADQISAAVPIVAAARRLGPAAVTAMLAA